MALTETWLNFRLTEKLKRRVMRAARLQDRSVASVIRRALLRDLAAVGEDEDEEDPPAV